MTKKRTKKLIANRVPNAFLTAVISTVLCVASFAPQVLAAAAIVHDTNADVSTYTLPSGTNLLTGAAVSPATANTHEGSSSNWATLTDGLLSTNGDKTASVTPNNGDSVTFTLDTSVNTFGYNLTSFDFYCAWPDSGREDMDFIVSYSTVANPTTFIFYTTVGNHGGNNATHTRITDTTATKPLNVKAIQISFANQENGFVGYREFVVLGTAATATAPSPAAGVLSVNFQANDPGVTGAILGTETAGLIPVTDWSNAFSQAGTQALNFSTSGITGLSQGTTAASGATVTWASSNTWSDGNDNSPNEKLFHGYLDDADGPNRYSKAIITAIPFAGYDVYLYHHSDDGDGHRHGDYFAVAGNDPGSPAYGSTTRKFGTQTHVYTPTLGDGAGGYGNVIYMGHFNSTALSLYPHDNDGDRGTQRSPLNAFQIVESLPTLISVTPNIGAIAGGTNVVIVGTDLASGLTASAFTFGGVAATAIIASNSPNSYTVTAPAHAVGVVNVVYTDSRHTATLTNGFTYSNTAPPNIISVTLDPTGTAVGPTGGGTAIKITGTNFVAGDLVQLGGSNGFTLTAATNVVVVNSTTITCTTPASVPALAAGPCRVSVIDPSNQNATSFLESGFLYTAPAPTVTSITPATGPYNVSTPVAINGTGFSPNFVTNTASPGTITCGGQTLLSLAYVSATQLTGTIQKMTNAMSSRKQDVVVTNPGGGSSAINVGDVFTYILRDPENDTGLQPGMIYRYYNNTTINNNLPLNQFPLAIDAFNKIGITNNFTVNPNPFEAGVTDNFAVDYTGMLNIPTDGVWNFTSSSDDGSLLYIGTTLVINNNGGHGQPGPAPTGSIGLKAGFHRFRLQFCEGGGGYGLQVSWAGPGVTQVDIPVGTADFTGAGLYCDTTPTLASLDVVSGALAGGTTINTVNTGSNFTTPNPTATPLTYPGNNPIGASTLTAVSVQTIPLTLVVTAPTAGQFAINANNTLTLSTPLGNFAGGAPIVLTTLNGLTAVLQPGTGGFSYTSNGTNYRTPENPVSTVPGVNAKFFRSSGARSTIAGIGAVLPTGGVTAMDALNPIRGYSLNPTSAPNLMTGPLADPDPNGTLLGFRDSDNNFYMKATGYIQITTPGLYTFTTYSDDETRMFFGNKEVIANIYPTGNAGFSITPVSNSINLGAGLHQYTIHYGQNIGNRGFALHYSGPDNGNVLGFVPDSVLFADSAPPAFAIVSPLTPAIGSFLGNTTVTATGTNFAVGAKVYVDGIQATAVTVASDGLSLTFRTPPGTVGIFANVVVVNPNGMPATLLGAFTYDNTARPPAFASPAASPCVPGSYFRYYSSGINGTAPGGPTLPNFASFAPSRVGVVPTAEYDSENTVTYPATQGDGFSLQYTGYILIPSDGTYSFYTASDDGSTMYIGGMQVVVGNNRGQGITTRSGPPIALKAGLHDYTVQFAEGNGGYGNYVGWGSSDAVPAIPVDPQAVYDGQNNDTPGSAHGGAPTTRIPSSAYYYIPPTFQAAGTSNWSTGSSWENSTNVGLGSFGPVQNTNVDDGAVDSVFRFNGNGVAPFTAVNDSINNTPIYVLEFNSNINGNVISGNTLKTLGSNRYVQYNSMTLPTFIQKSTGTVDVSAPLFNRDTILLTGDGTGVVKLSGTQTNYASGGDIKSIYKSGASTYAINGNASAYSGGGFNAGFGFIRVDGGTLGLNSTMGQASATVDALVGMFGTPATLRGAGALSGRLIVGQNSTVFPGDLTLGNVSTPTDTTNTLTNGTLGNLTVGDADFSSGGSLLVRVNSPTPGTISSDKLTVLSGMINLTNSTTLKIHVQASGTNATPSDTLIVDANKLNNVLNLTPFQSVVVTSKMIGGQAGNIGTNLQVLYVNSNTFVPNSNSSLGVVGVYTNGDATPPAITVPFDRIYVRLTGNVTPVTVDSFNATVSGAGVQLDWNCVSEFQNAGFNVYRRNVGLTEWTKVNPALIAGRVTTADQKAYQLYDWAPSGAYEYKLESVSTLQIAEPYSALAGPVTMDSITTITGGVSDASIVAAAEGVEALLNAGRTSVLSALFNVPMDISNNNTKDDAATNSLRANATSQSTRKAFGVARARDGSLLKPAAVTIVDMHNAANEAQPLAVTTSPVMSQASNPFAAARGFGVQANLGSSTFNGVKVVYQKRGVLLIPNAALPAGFDSGHVIVQRERRTVPILAQTADGLLVYGQSYEDDYTNRDALFLRPIAAPTSSGHVTHASGLFSSGQTANVNSPAYVTTAFHDVYYDYDLMFRPYTFAPWFSDKYLTADATTGTTQSFTVSTPFASSSAAALNVNVWSLPSTGSATPSHALQVVVNGVAVGQAVWNTNNSMVQLSFQLQPGTLAAGDNKIDLVTPPLSGVDSQTSFLHSLTCSYTRTLDGSRPVSVYNSSASSYLYELSNMPSSNAWVVDARFPDRAALVPYEAVDQGNGTFKLRFVGASGGTGEFHVVAAGLENGPESVTKRMVKPLKVAGTYLAVGPKQFSASVKPLLVQRAKEGLRGQFVDQEQLFDYYNNGRYGPAGIQNAVRSVRPKYLLLVGRTTYDYKNYSGLNIDPLCPSFLVSTSFWSQTTSDSTFGNLGLGYPEVSIGRLPVNTPNEASGVVKHILAYAGMPVTGWRSQFIADTTDPLVGDFAAEGDAIIAANPSITWDRNYLGMTYATKAETMDALRKAASGDADFIIYSGHGNASRWGKSETIADVASVQTWTGDVVLMTATCTFNWSAKLTQNYHSIPIQALSQPQGGIAASIGSTTYLNSATGAEFVNQLLKQTQGAGSRARWGDVVLRSQQWAHNHSAVSGSWYLDLSQTECLLGDPAMPLYSKGAASSSGSVQNSGVKLGTF